MPPLNPFSRTCLSLAISQALTLPANAATIEVNSTSDAGDGSNCTLREAVVSINSQTLIGVSGCSSSGSNFGVDDTIIFDNSLSGSLITLTQSKDLKINNPNVDLTIDGLGQNSLTVNGGDNSRVFYVQYATVSINSLTISGGSVESDGYGGGIFALESSVSLSNSTVSSNSAYYGGGIFALESSVSLSNSTVSSNSGYYGGGISAYESSVSLSNSTVSNNSAEQHGGGIYVSNSSTLSLANITVSNNSAEHYGGGISAYQSSVSLSNSTVSSNSGYYGGGISAYQSSVSLSNSTVSSNSASYGGGIYVSNSSTVSLANSTVSLANSTVSNNSAEQYGGGIMALFSSVSLVNSIISGNTADIGAEIYINSINTTLTAARNNLFGHNSLIPSAAFYNFTPGVSDINATSMDDTISIHLPTAAADILSTLANNGCTQKAGAPSSEACVQTNALVSNSPAIDAAGSHCPSTDQRGYSRNDANDSFFVPIITTGGKLAVVSLGEDECDIGSVEYQPGG